MHAVKWLVAGGWWLVVGAAACDPNRVSEKECDGLVDKYASLLTNDPALRKTARDEALKQGVLKSCTKELTRGNYVCAMQATTPEAFETCLPK